MEFVAEKTSHLFELEREGDGFCWQHSVERKIVFSKAFNKPMRLSRWNDFIPNAPAEALSPLELKFEINSSSRPFEYKIDFIESTAVGVTAAVTFNPHPGPGDWIDYFVSYRGRSMCVVYNEEITNPLTVSIDGKSYNVFDGIVPVNRAKHLEMQFRFPRGYKLDRSDVAFFVASFTRHIDYIVDSEIERALVKKEVVGGKLTITANVSSPLLRHVYGVAWMAPSGAAAV